MRLASLPIVLQSAARPASRAQRARISAGSREFAPSGADIYYGYRYIHLHRYICSGNLVNPSMRATPQLARHLAYESIYI